MEAITNNAQGIRKFTLFCKLRLSSGCIKSTILHIYPSHAGVEMAERPKKRQKTLSSVFTKKSSNLSMFLNILCLIMIFFWPNFKFHSIETKYNSCNLGPQFKNKKYNA